MSWKNIINQTRVKELLIASLKRKRMAHAYLFSGPVGSGKSATAIELAKVLNCTESETDACGLCTSCLKFNTLQHADVKLIFPLPVGKLEKAGDPSLSKLADDDIAVVHKQINLKALNSYHQLQIPRANTIKVNSIREIRRESSMSAFGKGKKVFIILEADKMNDESSNAILKTLEEPHENTLLILITSNPDALLSTIISRCQHIRFDQLSEDMIMKSLIEQHNLNSERAKAIAMLVNGNYSLALEYIDISLEERQTYAIEFLRAMIFKSRNNLLQDIDKITSEFEKQEIKDMFNFISQWLHDAMILQQGIGSNIIPRNKESLNKFIAVYPDCDYVSANKSIEKAVSLVDKNVYIPLIILDLSARMKQHIKGNSIMQSSVK